MSNESKTVTKSIRIQRGLKEALESQAEQENRNFNNMVETVLMRAGKLTDDEIHKYASEKAESDGVSYSVVVEAATWARERITGK